MDSRGCCRQGRATTSLTRRDQDVLSGKNTTNSVWPDIWPARPKPPQGYGVTGREEAGALPGKRLCTAPVVSSNVRWPVAAFCSPGVPRVSAFPFLCPDIHYYLQTNLLPLECLVHISQLKPKAHLMSLPLPPSSSLLGPSPRPSSTLQRPCCSHCS